MKKLLLAALIVLIGFGTGLLMRVDPANRVAVAICGAMLIGFVWFSAAEPLTNWLGTASPQRDGPPSQVASAIFILLIAALVLISLLSVPLLLVGIVLGMIPAAIAHYKGRNFFGWWFYGSLLWLVAMPHAIVARRLRWLDETESRVNSQSWQR